MVPPQARGPLTIDGYFVHIPVYATIFESSHELGVAHDTLCTPVVRGFSTCLDGDWG